MNELSKYLAEQILLTEEELKNFVVVYAGRFQPFHKGHFATYQGLVKKFGKDKVYIGTSNKTDNQKSPFNFKEKKVIMTKMFGISSNKIEVKGNVVLAKYFVYIEVYDFSVSEDEVVKIDGKQTVTQTTRLGLQVKFVDAETGQVIMGSGLGEASTVKMSSILGDVTDEVKFNQSTIGISTKKALETASSRIVSRMITKGIFTH
jgi:hypothetical protein